MSEERFWRKVDVCSMEECWPWLGTRTDRGYGVFWDNGKIVRAHRFSLELAEGLPPEERPFALHSCDNPSCVNPKHLRWGTTQDNSDDMVLRDRSARGELHPKADITEAQAREIILSRVSGMTCKDISLGMGLPETLVMNIYVGRAWSHLLGRDGLPSLQELKNSRPMRKQKAPNRVLTEEMIDAIFQGRINGKTSVALAKELCLPVGTVSPVYSGFAFKERLGNFGNPTFEELRAAFPPNPAHKVTGDMREEIILMIKAGFTGKSIAAKYGIGKATVSRIRSSIIE